MLGLTEGESVRTLKLSLLNLIAEVVEVDGPFGESSRVVHFEVATDASFL